MRPAIQLLVVVLLCLLAPRLALAELANGRYGAAQVFDVQRSPAFPVAGQNFTVSNFQAPFDSSFAQYSLAADEYIAFVKVSDTPCRYGISLYNAGGLVRVIHASGEIYGLGTEGFLHNSDPSDFGTFVSNAAGYAPGSSLSYVPDTGEATCLETAAYDANPTPITTPTAFYTIGGTVSGLLGSGLVLQNNGGDNLSVTADGAFTFATPLADGSSFDVTVLTQPMGPNQTCALVPNITKGGGPGQGIVSGANVNYLRVECTTTTYTIGGTVSGLVGSGLVLRNNGGDDLAISANGTFTFATPLADGSAYAVTVATQPSNPSQACSVSSGPGPQKGVIDGTGVVSGANVTDLLVECVTTATPPGAPTNVQVNINGGLASVSWTAPADDGGSPLTGYSVVLQPGGLTCTTSGNPPPTSCQISGVQSGVTYTATVVASNAQGGGAPGTGSGGSAAPAPSVIPVDQPWALALLGLLVLLIGGRGLAARR